MRGAPHVLARVVDGESNQREIVLRREDRERAASAASEP
jgi:hypothetical protein